MACNIKNSHLFVLENYKQTDSQKREFLLLIKNHKKSKNSCNKSIISSHNRLFNIEGKTPPIENEQLFQTYKNIIIITSYLLN